MKKRVGLVACLLVAGMSFAGSGWETDFEAAKKAAKEGNKHILVDFSGSDWCGWCIKLDEEVFTKKAFKDYAKENLVLVLLDFPRNKEQDDALKKQNETLAKRYGVRGFPTVFVLSPSGDVVAKTGYQAGGPEAYVKHIKSLISESKSKK